MKVNIHLKEDLSYCDVAYLIDRDDFQSDMENARYKFFVSHKINPERESKRWRGQLAGIFNPITSQESVKEVEIIEAKLLDLNYIHNLPHSDKEQLVKKLFTAERKINLQNDFDYTVMDLREKYHRHHYFEKIIESAIAYGEVVESDYTPYQIKWIRPEMEYPQLFQQVELVVGIYPCTRVNDLKKALKEAQKELPGYADYGLISPKEYFLKAKPMVRHHRRAYWMKKLNPNTTYAEITKKLVNQGCGWMNDERTTEKAIKTYKDWLGQ